MTTSKQKEIKQIAKRIEKEYQPEKIILFGSFAWGKPNESSDVDLFIIKKSNLPRRFRTTQVEKLLDYTPYPLDILVYTPQEIKKREKLNDFFVKNILERGEILYAK